MSLWDTIEKKYFKKSASANDPHWFVSTRKDVTPNKILGVYDNMNIIGKGVTGDSE